MRGIGREPKQLVFPIGPSRHRHREWDYGIRSDRSSAETWHFPQRLSPLLIDMTNRVGVSAWQTVSSETVLPDAVSLPLAFGMLNRELPT